MASDSTQAEDSVKGISAKGRFQINLDQPQILCWLIKRVGRICWTRAYAPFRPTRRLLGPTVSCRQGW
jgi:hypothetical protein